MQTSWEQNPNSKLRVITLQKKALRIINNQPRNSHPGPWFKQNNILKFEDKILIGNIISVSQLIFYHQFSKICFYSVPRFTSITQSYRQLRNYLSLRIEMIPMLKNLCLEVLLTAAIKPKTSRASVI